MEAPKLQNREKLKLLDRSRISSVGNKILNISDYTDRAGRNQFESVRNSIEEQFLSLDQEAQEVMANITAIRSEILGIKKLLLKAALSVGLNLGKKDKETKELKQRIDELRSQIPRLINKINDLSSNAEARLSEIHTSESLLQQEIELYRQQIHARIDGLRSMLGPLGSQALSLASNYVKILRKIEKVKQVASLAKKAEIISGVATALPAIPIIIVVVVIIVVVFFSINFLKNPGLDKVDILFQCQVLGQPLDQSCTNAIKDKIGEQLAPDPESRGSITNPVPTFEN